jgi:hypothetical protein
MAIVSKKVKFDLYYLDGHFTVTQHSG